MAGSTLVRCTLRTQDGGTEVIVSSDTCSLLGGEEKGVPTPAEATNWQAATKSTLQTMLASSRVPADKRPAFEAVIRELG